MESTFSARRMLILILEINPLRHTSPHFMCHLSHFNESYPKFEDLLSIFISQKRLSGIFEMLVSGRVWRFQRTGSIGFFSWGKEKKRVEAKVASGPSALAPRFFFLHSAAAVWSRIAPILPLWRAGGKPVENRAKDICVHTHVHVMSWSSQPRRIN